MILRVITHAFRRVSMSLCGLDMAMRMVVCGSFISFVLGNAQREVIYEINPIMII